MVNEGERAQHIDNDSVETLDRRYPTTSFGECEDALARCEIFDDASYDLEEMLAEVKFGLKPLSPRRGFAHDALSPVAAATLNLRWIVQNKCCVCNAPCSKWHYRYKCARCSVRTYCSRECQVCKRDRD